MVPSTPPPKGVRHTNTGAYSTTNGAEDGRLEHSLHTATWVVRGDWKLEGETYQIRTLPYDIVHTGHEGAFICDIQAVKYKRNNGDSAGGAWQGEWGGITWGCPGDHVAANPNTQPTNPLTSPCSGRAQPAPAAQPWAIGLIGNSSPSLRYNPAVSAGVRRTQHTTPQGRRFDRP
jgi:hypothetical protein